MWFTVIGSRSIDEWLAWVAPPGCPEPSTWNRVSGNLETLCVEAGLSQCTRVDAPASRSYNVSWRRASVQEPRPASDPSGGPVAQLGERLNGIQEVVGSIPFRSTS